MRTATGWVLALAAMCVSCATGSSNTVAGAATMTALAVGAAAAERAAGRCIAVCTNGTACNPNTGFCERIPSCDKCAPGDRCEQTFSGAKCVPGEAASVTAKAPGKPPAATVVPIVDAPDSNHSSPSVVPAAEKQPPK